MYQSGDAVNILLTAGDVDPFSFVSSRTPPELATNGANSLAFGLKLPVGRGM